MSATGDIPAGYYAIPIHDSDDYELDDPRFCQLVGYHLIHKSARGALTTSARQLAGLEADRLVAALEYERDMYGDRHYLNHLTDPDLAHNAREAYGQLTGRCGYCHRHLTDPASIQRGIGPECRKIGGAS